MGDAETRRDVFDADEFSMGELVTLPPTGESCQTEAPDSSACVPQGSLEEYEILRAQLTKELGILRVQENMRRAVFKAEEDGIELNFYDGSRLKLSKLASSGEAELSISDEDGTLEGDSRSTEKEVADTGDAVTVHRRPQSSKKGIHRLVDLEAECSEEDQDDTGEEDVDLEDLIDPEYVEDDTAMGKFAEDEERKDKELLREFKRQFFTRKGRAGKDAAPKGIDFEGCGMALGSCNEPEDYDSTEGLGSTQTGVEDFYDISVRDAAEVAGQLPAEDTISVRMEKKVAQKGLSFARSTEALDRLMRKGDGKGFGFKEAE